MITIYVNGKSVQAREDATVLEASREDKYASTQFDINVLSLNYLKGVQEVDESGLCLADIEGMGIVNASTVKVQENMQITTNSPEVQELQKEALRKILDRHNLECKKCLRTGNCELQVLQHTLRTTKTAETMKYSAESVDDYGIIVRDNNKCVRCGRCVAVCNDIQGIGAIKMQGEGMDGKVVCSDPAGLAASGCVNCGQCVTVCPVGAMSVRDDVDAICAAIADPEKTVVVQVAPSVRVSLGEAFRYPVGSETKGKIAAACRALGFDKVFDTVFGADLTIMEEAKELAARLASGEKLPMFTSCCPGWISYCEEKHPELLPQISSCKSPQQMFGAMTKTYLAEKEGLDLDKLVVVSVMPCTAKKYEKDRANENAAGVPDVDYAITNRELARMIEKANISFISLDDEAFDDPLGIGSGAGTIFGAAGGVMEAALRTAKDVYGIENARIATVSGLAEAEKLITDIQAGKAAYDFVEVMACPGGCVNGGGQPQQSAERQTVVNIRTERAESLYHLDAKSDLRESYKNSAIKALYEDYLGEPGSEKAAAYLHTTYQAKEA